ncbi:MAG: hypothetical protein IJA32_03755 [Lachnospiraceae bacterium]|nr:hypothetical protein [Lachnospiraceae bacterium]
MKKNIIIGIVGAGIVVALLFGFKELIDRSEDRESSSNNKNGSSLELDIERVYPKTPSEVVKKFAEINKYVYSNEVSDEKMEEIVANLRLLYDQEFLAQSSEDIQVSAFTSELFNADSVNRRIMNYEVDGDEKVEYKENKYGELAAVNAVFYLKEDDGYPSEKYTFILRKDEDGKWKILGWDYTKQFSGEQEETISE